MTDNEPNHLYKVTVSYETCGIFLPDKLIEAIHEYRWAFDKLKIEIEDKGSVS